MRQNELKSERSDRRPPCAGPRLWCPLCGHRVFPVRSPPPPPSSPPGTPLRGPLLETCLCPTAHSSQPMEGPLSLNALGPVT